MGYLSLAAGVFVLTLIGLSYKISPHIEIHLSEKVLQVGLTLDHLAGVMLTLVVALGSVVLMYSSRYLLSDHTRVRFMCQLIATISSVIFFILASNLLTAFIAWQWIGFNLYLLLNHYHYQSEANRSAKKKFIINRLGDICFLVAIVLCYHFYGTSEYNELASIASTQLSIFDLTINAHTLILSLVFIAIMTKSAQYPFYFWLPDTMQTPTPVSALMHAGVINAGGVLLARLSNCFTQAGWLPYFILFIGLLSMATGSILKSVQPDVKKKLAYSTMSQMGYMLTQSAFGCFSAAVFHLMAHGFYKAALFLNSGSELFTESKHTNASPLNKISLFILASIITLALLLFLQSAINQTQATLFLLTFIAISVHQMIFSALQSPNIVLKILAVLFCQVILIGYLWLLNTLESWLGFSNISLINKNIEYALCVTIVSIYILSFFLSNKTSPKNKVLGKGLIKLSKILQIETAFRTYLLGPIRRLGDILNHLLFFTLIKKVIAISFLMMIPLFAVTAPFKNHNAISYLLLLEIITCLLIANRARILANAFMMLGIVHFCLFAIAYQDMFNPQILIPYCTIFGGLLWLAWQADDLKNNRKVVVENRLTQWGLYLAISLFLLIGIPGTASFIFWFNLITHMITHPFIILGFMIANVLLAIVVLHILQDYVFNLRGSHELAENKKSLGGMIFLIIILTNLYFGIFQITV